MFSDGLATGADVLLPPSSSLSPQAASTRHWARMIAVRIKVGRRFLIMFCPCLRPIQLCRSRVGGLPRARSTQTKAGRGDEPHRDVVGSSREGDYVAGSPAIMGTSPVDRRLCVLTFRWVCLCQRVAVLRYVSPESRRPVWAVRAMVFSVVLKS
jgi:hypothetical protein